MIIGIGGEKGSGKDTAAEVLINKQGFKRTAFADPLKQLLNKALGIDLSYFYDIDLKDKPFDTPYIISTSQLKHICDLCGANEATFKQLSMFIWEGTSPRDLMQKVGTEMVRTYIDPQYWVKQTIRHISDGSNWVITDVRMANERKALHQINGNLVRIIRTDLNNDDPHKSENDLGSLDEYDFVVYNDSSVVKLHSKIEDIGWGSFQV